MHNLIYIMKPGYKGSGLHAQYLAESFPYNFKSYDLKLGNIPTRDRIWILHNPSFYDYPITARAHDISFVRENFCKAIPGKKMTNGFSYFKRYADQFDAWFPTIYQSNFNASQDICIGYYMRDCRQQSNYAFADFAEQCKGIPIITMGQIESVPLKLRQNKKWRHTTDNQFFWSSCSHYFYYRCSDIEDPFPHTLLEAIQSNHRIISPIDIGRTHRDGIDDLLSFIEYDLQFDDSKEGSQCDALDASNWSNIINFAEQNDFPLLPFSQKTLYDEFCKMKDIYG